MKPGLRKQHFSDTVTYGFSDGLVKLLGFVTVPILTRLLNPADYGILELLVICVAFATPVAMLGSDFSLQTFYLDKELFPTTDAHRALVSSNFWCLMGWGGALIALGWVAAPYLSRTAFDGKLDPGPASSRPSGAWKKCAAGLAGDS